MLNINLDKSNEQSNFYDLGGDSISAFILLSKIEEIFSISMTIEQLIFYQAIDTQAQFIADQNSHKDPLHTTIINLNSTTDTPIFLIHPIGGTIFWYLYLSQLLDKKIQVYGIQDPGISTGHAFFTTIHEMANYYTKCILSQAPKNQYILGGASFGATVAIEIAKNLIRHNCPVKSVLIFDGWAVYPKQLGNKEYFIDSMLRQQNDWVNKFKQSNYDSSNFEKILKIQMNRLKMLFNYKMEPFNFHVDIFKAKEIMPIFQSIDDPHNHWDNFTKDFNLFEVPGNHETMFLKPNVKTLASTVFSNLEKLKLS